MARELDPRVERELFEAALGEGLRKAAARKALEADPSRRESLRELEQELAAAKGQLGDVRGWSRQRERLLVQCVLARTTRGAPAGRRFRGAQWGGAAAAVLVALTVLRPWGGARRDSQGGGTQVAAAPSLACLVPVESAVPELLSRARAELASTAAAASHGGGEARVGEEPLEVRLLEARARGLRERRWEPWLREVPVTRLGPLALALWCEVELDRYVLGAERPPAWSRVIERLETLRAPSPEESRLISHALQRARAYGLAEGRGEVAATQVTLWSPEWFSDLEAAGRAAGLARCAPWQEWIRWRGEAL